jgi:hypothetical protein
MIPHIPEEFSTRLINWRPFVIVATRCRPEIPMMIKIPMMTTRTKRKTAKTRTETTSRRLPVVREPDEE